MLETVYNAYVETSDPVARRHLARALRALVIAETLRDLPKGKSRVRGLTPDEVHLGQHVGKIPTIKAYHTRTNTGLKEAKDAVEAYFEQNGLTFYSSGNPW